MPVRHAGSGVLRTFSDREYHAIRKWRSAQCIKITIRTSQNALLGLENEQYKKLKTLSNKTRVPMAAYLREALDDLLKKYKKELRK